LPYYFAITGSEQAAHCRIGRKRHKLPSNQDLRGIPAVAAFAKWVADARPEHGSDRSCLSAAPPSEVPGSPATGGGCGVVPLPTARQPHLHSGRVKCRGAQATVRLVPPMVVVLVALDFRQSV